MAFLTACRKARAWQQHIKALSSINSLHYDYTSSAIGWLDNQRFHSTATTPLAAAAEAANVQATGSVSKLPVAKRHGRQKRQKLDEDILASAKRVFALPYGINTEQDPLDGSVDETEEEATSSSSSFGEAQPQPNISAELLQEHNEMLAAMDKKRERNPVWVGHNLESWFNDNRPRLQPFLNFLHSHGANQPRTVAALYEAGYWGRNAMLVNKKIPKEETTSMIISTPVEPDDNDLVQVYHFDKMFSNWTDALRKEDVHITAENLLLRWPRMLTRQPFKLGATLAILRAALPDGTDIHDLIEKVPRILGIYPGEMQNRIIQLQMATEGELQRMLVRAPALLTYSLDSIFANLRLIREHSRSAREFKSFLYTSPSALERPVKYLRNASRAVRNFLEKILPPGVDAVEIIKAKPQLLLVRGGWLGSRWHAIEEAVCLVDEWKEEYENLIADAAAMPRSSYNSAAAAQMIDSLDSNTASVLFSPQRAGDGSDEILSPPPPEWLHKDMDPHSLGVKLEQLVKKDEDTIDTVEDAEITDEDEDEAPLVGHKDKAYSKSLSKGRKAYSALGEALWMRPWRIQRLEYMAEHFPEEAQRVSFVSAMAVTLEQFEERYPEFHNWVERKQEERDAYYEERRKDHESGIF